MKTPRALPVWWVLVLLAAVALVALWKVRPQPAPAARVIAAQTPTPAPKVPTPTPPVAAPSTPVAAAATPAVAPRITQALPNFDRRAEIPGHDRRLAALDRLREEREREAERLRAAVPGVRVDFDEALGSPKFVASTEGFLATADGTRGAVPAGRLAAFPAGDPQGLVKAFLDEYAGMFSHGAAVLREARLVRDYATPHNGMRTLVWQQELEGIRVFESTLQAHVTRGGDLVNVASRLVPDPAAAAPDRAAALVNPRIDARTAVSAAAKTLGEDVPPAQIVESTPAQGAARQQQFRSAALSDVSTEIVWLPEDEMALRLCWEVVLTSKARGEMYRTLVDAESGTPLLRQGLTEYISNASYRVFTSDSPSPMSPGLAAPGTTQPSTVARTLVTLDALDPTASPNGWINDGINETVGNNVDAHLDLNADNIADTPRPQGSPNRVFDFPLDLTQEPTAYRDAAVTQLFYWCNFIHDKLYKVGFTEAAGNFQVNNFGNGGLGNDAVQADAQDGSGTNNANFSTPSDGSSGRMQMFLWTGSTPDRDGDFDAEVVLHEYTHGLSNRLVGGGVGISALVPRGMGEGWSDFYGITLLTEANDDLNGNWARGGYSRYGYGGTFLQNYYFGGRRYPYSTNLLKNPLTFKDIDPAQASAHSGIPLSPIVGGTADEVHNMGEVWCVTLWEARASLVNKHGFATGNNLILQIVTDGMKLSPANPTFVQARDAIIQADLVDNAGANRNELWAAFAKRGLGASASAPVSSTTVGLVEAYDLPDNLVVTPAAPFAATGPVGGPFTPGTQVYTLRNNGAAAISWTASKSQNWLTLSATSGTLAAGATINVTATLNASALSAGSYADTVAFYNPASGANLVRSVSLTVSPPRVYYYALDTDPGWTRTGQWAFGHPTGLGGTYYGYPDPANGATGTNVLGVNLTGDYSTTAGGPYYVTTAALNLTGYAGTRLQFQRRLNSDYQSYAYATVAVSNNGTTWTQLWSNGTTTISDSAWTKVQYDLSAVADNKPAVYVRWGYQVSSGAYPYSGWNIDDIEILGVPAANFAISLQAAITEGDAPASGTVTALPATSSDLLVTLVSSLPARLSVPASVTIPAGATTATFPATAINDALLNGPATVTVTASAAGWTAQNATILVQDNDVATLALSLPATATEGAGTVTGTVTASVAPTTAATVQLSSEKPGEALPPATVTIPAGQTQATFALAIIDDPRIDGTQTVTVTASVPTWTSGSAQISVLDNESANLGVAVPANVREGDTGKTGTVSLSGTLTSDLVVALNSNDTSEITVPTSVTIAAGQTSATFALTVVNDTETDGPQTAVVTASAAGFTNGTGAVVVADDEVHHFAFGTIANPQARGVGFAVTLTAQDASNGTITNYTGTMSLTGAGSAGALTLTPTTASGFSNGVWSGTVTVSTLSTNVVLTASDGAGHTATSNAFDVGVDTLDHFTWSAIVSPQVMDTPFAATITAADASNNPITNFNGTANLTAFLPIANPPTGTGTSTIYYPYYGYYSKSRTQTIYLASELGGAARLAALALYVGSTTTQVFNTWTIRLKHTTQSTTTSSWDGSGWTVVHQSSVTPSATGWLTFNFTTPFNYNGTSNLLVDFSYNNATATGLSSSVAYCQAAAVSGRTLYGYSNSNDPLTWSGTSGALPFSGSYVLNALFSAERPVGMTPESVPFNGGVWSGNVAVPFAASGVRLQAAQGTHSGLSNTFAVNAPAGSGGGATTVFSENFESGTLNNWTITGTGYIHTINSILYSPHGGTRHLTMDENGSGSYARNEATLTLNLAGRTGVTLSFWAKGFSEAPHGPPASPFPSTGADFDGVAISADGGTNWYEVQGLRSLTSTYTAYSVNLDTALAARGLSYSSNFKIRFNQYDNNYLPYRGIAIDDILVTGTPANSLAIALPAQAVEGAGAVTGSVSLPAAQGVAVTVALSSNSPAKITVPASVVVPAGQTSANFTLTVLDDTVLDGTKTVAITAAAAGLSSGAASIQVLDNETGALSVSVPASAAENAGTVQGTVTLASPPAGNVTVALASSDPTAATVPASVTFTPGQTSAAFTITLIDDAKIDGPQNATITASVAGWTSASGTIAVTDSENTNLTLSAASVTEGTPVSGSVSVSGTMTNPLTVTLTSANSAQLSVPATVTIPAGSTSASFTMTAVDDAAMDGRQTVTLTATAAGFTSAAASVLVYDNELHHFTVTGPTGAQYANKGFTVSASAQSIDNYPISSYGSTVPLTALAGGGALPVTPAGVTFSGGSWNATVTVQQPGTGVVLKLDDGAGHTGTSSAFDVGVLAASTLAWSTVPSSVAPNAPFTATLSALDIYSNLVTAFNGTASLTCGPQALTIGTGTNGWEQPMNLAWHDSRTQSIYLASELGGARRITGLALKVNNVPLQTLSAWTIRMKHTTQSSYATGSPWESTGWTTVYQANLVLSATGWASFTFSTPFDYDGTSNLLIDFSHNNSTSTSACYVAATAGTVARSLYYYSNSSFGDPLTWSATTPPGWTSTYLTNVRLRSTPTIPVSPDTVTFANGAWTGAINLGATGTGLTLTADTGSGVSGESNVFDSSAVASIAVTPAGPLTTTGVRGVAFTPLAHTFNVKNSGSGTMNWTASTTTPWISLSQNGGTLGPAATATVTATLDAAALNLLAVGTYNGAITFTNTTSGIGNTTRAVNVTVVPFSELTVSPETPLAATGPFGGPFAPTHQTYTLTNTGDSPLDWTASKTASWLTLSSPGGTLAAGASTSVTAAINAAAAALNPGTFSDGIAFTNTSNSRGNTTRPVTLTVILPAPTLAAEPPITPATSNAISWSPVAGADTYEAQSASDAAFTGAVSTGWIAGTGHTFSGLSDDTLYRYRARARRIVFGAASTWTQTTQAEFDTGAKSGVVTNAPGEVILGPAAGTVIPGRMVNAGFESLTYTAGVYTITGWTSGNSAQMGVTRNISPMAPMPTEGSYSLNAFTYAGAALAPGDSAFANQTIDLTGARTLVFDAMLLSTGTWSGTILGEVRIDGVTVWSKAPQGVYLNQSVDLSAYTGTHTLEFRNTVTVAGTYSSQWVLWDNLRLVSPPGYVTSGTLTSATVTPSSWRHWGPLAFNGSTTAAGSGLTVDVLNSSGALLAANIASGTDLNGLAAVANQASIRLRANLSTTNSANSPRLDDWSLTYFAELEQTFLSAWSNVEASTQFNAPPTISGLSNQTIAEEGSTGPLTFTIADDTTPTTALVIAAASANPAVVPAGGVQLTGAGATRAIQVTPSANAFGSAAIIIRVTDDAGKFTEQTLQIAVAPVNDPPGFTKGGNQIVLEDASPRIIPGWATNVSAGPANESAQALDFNATNNHATLFSSPPAVAPDGTLSFTPAPNASGTATITVSLHDDGGTAGGGSDTSAAQSFTITIKPVNDAPAFVKGPDQTVPEDSAARAIPGWATQISAGPADEAAQVLDFIVSTDNAALFTAAPAITPDGTLTYTPAPNANGSATVTVQLHDNGGTADGGADTSAPQTFTIDLTPVNDPPTLEALADLDLLEDAPEQIISLTGIGTGASNEAQTLVVTAASSDPAVIPIPLITYTSPGASGTLRLQPAANASGSATITITVSDGGAEDSTVTRTFLVRVSTVNDAPSFVRGPDQTALEDTGKSVAGWATQISAGSPDESTQALDFIVTHDHAALFAAAPAILPDGTLTYTPVKDANGTATVTVRLHDSGGTAHGGSDTSAPQTFTITFLPVNDAPSFVKGPDQHAWQSGGAQTVVGWATAVSPGPADESAQTLHFIVTTDHPDLFETEPALAADGTLTFTPAAEINGAARVMVQLQDNGGTAHGGSDTSPAQSFIISSNVVNDAPSFVMGANLETAQDAGPQTFPAWATQISAGPADEAGQSVDFRVTVDQSRLFATPPAIAADGTLTYTPATDASGTAKVTVQLHDNGGTDAGGVDLSAAQTFTIAVTTFATGTYNGLVRTAEELAPAAERSGLIRVTIDKKGRLTGKLTLGGKAQAFKGAVDHAGVIRFAPAGTTTWDYTRPNQPPLSVELRLDVAGGTDTLTGTIEEGDTAFAVLDADRALYSAGAAAPYRPVPPELLGAYTVVFAARPPEEQELPAAQFPQGDGAGTLRVTSDGNVRLTGTLADGTKVSYANALSKANVWPLYHASDKGYALTGPVSFRDVSAVSDLDGLGVWWFRPSQPGPKYPAGWPGGIRTDLIGARYQNAKAAVPASAPAEHDANATLLLTDGGLPAEGLVQALSVDPSNHVEPMEPNDAKATLKINPATGLFTGTFEHPVSGQSTKFQGAILQKQERGAGAFFTNTEVGGAGMAPSRPGPFDAPAPPPPAPPP
ncbi:MAG: large repetitive protein [Chthoniobacter sp.]|jgi:hypothetical protein|nr:large repetitive protein [Chthoniobacter sp.]